MNSDDARAVMLRDIAKALADEPAHAQPQAMRIFEDADESDLLSLAQRFRVELALLGGETRFVASDEDLPAAVAAFVNERNLGPASVDFAAADYALLEAQALLADTGSAIVIERSADRRLAPYLPRTCIIVGEARSLHAHMSDVALAPVFAAARGGDKGEAVIITGPSRTADIEKTLVLGAHGPRHLAVFIVGIREP